MYELFKLFNKIILSKTFIWPFTISPNCDGGGDDDDETACRQFHHQFRIPAVLQYCHKEMYLHELEPDVEIRPFLRLRRFL